MHAAKLLHNLFDKSCKIDVRIKRAIFLASETLINCKQLSISAIGRHLPHNAKIKNNIKRMDRLFGNKTLCENGVTFYKCMAQHLIKDNKKPVILIDASRLTRCGTYHVLRASLPVKGRSLTLNDEVYQSNEYQNPKCHSKFLKTLKGLLPIDCKPIIITDAGFRNTWFKQVMAHGWDFIGRVRNTTYYCARNTTKWKPINDLYQQATLKVRFLGCVMLSKSSTCNRR